LWSALLSKRKSLPELDYYIAANRRNPSPEWRTISEENNREGQGGIQQWKLEAEGPGVSTFHNIALYQSTTVFAIGCGQTGPCASFTISQAWAQRARQ